LEEIQGSEKGSEKEYLSQQRELKEKPDVLKTEWIEVKKAYLKRQRELKQELDVQKTE